MFACSAVDYVFWRKLKTSKNSVRIVVKSDFNGKIFFEVFPDTYIMYSFFAGGIDGSFGEFLADNVGNIFINSHYISFSHLVSSPLLVGYIPYRYPSE